MALHTYNPKQVACIVSGAVIKFDEISISKDGEKNMITEGTNGELSRTVKSDRLGTISVTLPQTSSDNAIFAALSATNGVYPILIKDNSGASIFAMSEAVLQKDPDVDMTNEAGQITWDFIGEFESYVPGGNV